MQKGDNRPILLPVILTVTPELTLSIGMAISKPVVEGGI